MIGRMPHLAIAQSGVDVTRSSRIGEQCVWHVVEGLRQPARQCLPWRAPNRADNRRLSIVLAVRFEWTGSKGGIPHFGMNRVGGNRPAIVPVKTISGLLPVCASIPTDGHTRTITTALIDPLTIRDIEGKGVAIAQRSL